MGRERNIKNYSKRGKSGEIFDLKHPVGLFLGRERNLKSYSKRGKSGKILFKTSGWTIFGQREEHKKL